MSIADEDATEKFLLRKILCKFYKSQKILYEKSKTRCHIIFFIVCIRNEKDVKKSIIIILI